MRKNKLAVIMSHPIQYRAPFLRKLSAHSEIDLTAYFFWDFGVKETMDPEFKTNIKWDIPLLEGYKYKFIKNYAFRPSSSFWGQFSFGIIKELILEKYDAVVVYGWNSFPNWCVFLTAPLVGTKIIIFGESPYFQEIIKSKLLLIIKKVILGVVFKIVGAIGYIGKQNRRFYEFYGVPKEKLFFEPFAVDNEFFLDKRNDLSGRREEFRKEYGFRSDDVVWLFVGKFIYKKRPQDLLNAYKRAVINNSKIKLMLVGDGELKQELEKEAMGFPGVVFVGFKNQTELPKFYMLADAFVLPSGAGETWGLVVNEAMCFGLPVVVSDMVGCGPDLVKEGENGFIFPLGNIDVLAKHIEHISSSVERRKEFGSKSEEIVKKYSHKTDVDAIAKTLLDFSKQKNNE
jgi:glycosyltransferase involved in cell wall biosynthesis